MTRLVLPALRANDTLGFLAALGVLALCEDGLRVRARLGWEGPDGAAVLDVPFEDTPELVTALGNLAANWRALGQLTPAADPALISAKPRKGAARTTIDEPGVENRTAANPDPMKTINASAAINRYHSMQDREMLQDGPDSRWLLALVSQLVPAVRGGAFRRLTPLYSPSGQMTLAQIYRDFLGVEQISRPAALEEALHGWRRATGPKAGAGANLDSRAFVNGVDSSSAKTANRHVPGATWLALQSAAWFSHVGNGLSGEAVAWTYPPGGAKLRWPVWSPQLTPDAVRVLLAHPAVRWIAPSAKESAKAKEGRRAQAQRERQRGVLGVCALYEAGRGAFSQSAGPLQPPVLLWQA